MRDGADAKPRSREIAEFIDSYQMYSAIVTVANGDFLKIERVLDSPWVDVAQHIMYLNDKAYAEMKEQEFQDRIRKTKSR